MEKHVSRFRQPAGARALTCAFALAAALLLAPALGPGPSALAATPAGTGTQAGTGTRTVAAKATAGSSSLDKATRQKLVKRFTQAIESMRTVESARYVKAGSLKIRASKKNEDRIARLLGDIVNFHPEYFYVSTPVTLVRGSDGCYKSFELHYAYKFKTLQKRLAKCEKGLKNLLSWVPADGTDLQKVKAVHDWLVRNCTYDANAEHEKNKRSPYNIYGALVTHKPVCQGYALTFLLAMRQLGIEATCVGEYIGDDGHMWNRVKIDGSWYNVDVTLDDPYAGIPYSYQDGGFYATPSTRYFMKSDAWWKKHLATGGWHASWYPKGKKASDTRYDSKKSWETYLRAASSPSKPTSPIVVLGDAAPGTRLELGSGSTAGVYQVRDEGSVSYRSCRVSAKRTSAKVPGTVRFGERSFSVAGISKGAFAGSGSAKVTSVTVTAKGLTAKSVKGCFSGSKVRVVKVPASLKSAYKKIFAKANSGRSVKVRSLG